MTRGHSEQKNGEDRQRSSASNNAHAPNGDKVEKDPKSGQDAPIEQHRSSRRPKQRHPHSSR